MMHTSFVRLFIALACAVCVAHSSPIQSVNEPSSNRIRFQRRQDGKYPPPLQTAPPSMLPQTWRDALNQAVQQGKIPQIPASTTNNGQTTYPDNLGSSKDVCSWTTMKCNGPNDFWQAPDGVWVVSFDDGPTGYSPDLYDFLASQNQSATHFMIGSQILSFQQQFQQAMSSGQEAAVHTWSHQLMTGLSNEEVVGELGWTMQIIYDLSGRVPTLWRPPQGDLDNRVRAIAEQLFGLTAVMWDKESNDWCIQEDGQSACPSDPIGNSQQSVAGAISQAVQGAKSPGVIMLEHELTTPGIGIFKNAYPTLRQNGWNPMSVSDAMNKDWYFNAHNSDDEPATVTDMVAAHTMSQPASQSSPDTSSPATSPASSPTPSGSAHSGDTGMQSNDKSDTIQGSKQSQGLDTSAAMHASQTSMIVMMTIASLVVVVLFA